MLYEVITTSIPVTSITLNDEDESLYIGSTYQLSASILPEDADDPSVTWSTESASIATVDQNGRVTAVAQGTVNIIVTSNENAALSDTCTITVQVLTPASLALDDNSKYTSTTYLVGGTLDVTAAYEAGTGNTVSSYWGGVRFFLREMNSSWAVVKDYTADCASAIGTQNGTATAGISLVGVTATADLPAGNFYFLYAVFQNSTGTDVNIAGVTPISIERAVIPVTGVSITDASVSLNIGNTITLQAEVTPADATNKEVVWSSANESIATVDASTGAVTAVSAGTTTITVTTVDGGYTATVEVSVP